MAIGINDNAIGVIKYLIGLGPLSFINYGDFNRQAAFVQSSGQKMATGEKFMITITVTVFSRNEDNFFVRGKKCAAEQ